MSEQITIKPRNRVAVSSFQLPPTPIAEKEAKVPAKRGRKPKVPAIKYEKKEMNLTPEQVDWINTILDLILVNDNFSLIDNSVMGRGKTMIQIYLAKHFEIPIIVVGPEMARETWRRHGIVYSAEILDFITYGGLASTKNSEPKHGYLHRYDDNGPEFVPTDKLKRIVESGVLFVFDEYHLVKNSTSARSKACLAISRFVNSNNKYGKSYCSFLSGTPITADAHINNTLRFMNVMTADAFAEQQDGISWEPVGLTEVVDYAESLYENGVGEDVDFTRARRMLYAPKKERLAKEMYDKIIKYRFAGMIADTADGSINGNFLNVYNLVAEITGDSAKSYSKAIATLGRMLREDSDSRDPELIKAITAGLKTIDMAKPELYAKFTERFIEEYGAKVIVGVNYLDVMSEVVYLLESLGYNVLTLKGADTKEERIITVNRFNTEDTIHALVMTTATGGVAIDLHDTLGPAKGGRPRYMILGSSYHMDSIVQATYRIFRQGLMSDANAFILYGGVDNNRDANGRLVNAEKKILSNLSAKSSVLLKSLVGDSFSVVPSMYGTVIEDRDGEFETVIEMDTTRMSESDIVVVTTKPDGTVDPRKYQEALDKVQEARDAGIDAEIIQAYDQDIDPSLVYNLEQEPDTLNVAESE